MSISPYFQKKTSRNHGACQIDLMIQTIEQSLYICEIKFQKRLDPQIIKEVERKLSALPKKRNWSYRPALIYEGEIDPNEQYKFEAYFSKLIRISSLMH
jgi:hypothetical protein